MKIDSIKKLTPHKDVNEILVMLSESLQDVLRNRLIAVYLTGSLTYGDFDRGSSDLDFLIVLHDTLSQEQREQVKNMHTQIAKNYPLWAKRIEASYITEAMLQNTAPQSPPVLM